MKIYLSKGHNGLKSGVYEVAVYGERNMMLKLPISNESWQGVNVPVYVSAGKSRRRILIKRKSEGWNV